eukprot:TRINITY_DN1786_c0_g1_i2.p1 TRINITY_DN1786_c0_g1~~TRINITY_DN1786_c0_g1_i2.p1  ORF type:complete len:104 (-),score=14.08 TRINITY_DN1786_c0_g1_i2:129-440(-)
MRLLLLFSIIGLYLLLIFSASTLSYSYENTNPKKVGVMSVVCPNNANCPTGDTCCPLSGNDGYGCCPDVNATCCEDGRHCCPQGYDCDIANQRCMPSEYDIYY